jgi:hypothetical protein
MFPQPPSGLTPHIKGVGGLFQLEGPRAFQSGTPHKLFAGFLPLLVRSPPAWEPRMLCIVADVQVRARRLTHFDRASPRFLLQQNGSMSHSHCHRRRPCRSFSVKPPLSRPFCTGSTTSIARPANAIFLWRSSSFAHSLTPSIAFSDSKIHW